MTQAKHYILAGQTYHRTHRCHDRSFLFLLAIDLSRLIYCITSNQTDLPVRAHDAGLVIAMMQQLEDVALRRGSSVGCQHLGVPLGAGRVRISRLGVQDRHSHKRDG